MEREKLKVNGEHFAKVLETFLADLKWRIRTNEATGRLKSNPLMVLYRSDRLTKEYVLAEMPKLQNRTSTLSSGERAVLKDIIGTCIRKAAIEEAEARQKAKEQLDKEAEAKK